MNDTKTAFVKIEGIESTEIPKFNSTVFNLKTSEGDFNFWKTKKDGDPTVAYSQYQKFRFVAGDEVEVVYKEVDASYNHKTTGKKIEKVNKTITKFIEDDDIPSATQIKNTKDIDNFQSAARKTGPIGEQTREEFKQDVLAKLDLIIEMLNEKPESIPVVDMEDDVNAELGVTGGELDPSDDLGF